MCGINIIVDRNKALGAGPIEAMNEALAHRGPDGNGTLLIQFSWGNVWLGATRLAVRPSGDGHQPQYKESQGAIVYNGEAYEIAESLPPDEADTPAVLAALLSWAEAAAPQFQAPPSLGAGMYALGFAHVPSESLTILTDIFGVKPLYYSLLPNGVSLFSSEINGLLAAGLLLEQATVVDDVEVRNWLSFRHAAPGRTLWQGIQKMLPGSTFIFSKDGLRPFPPRFKTADQDLLKQLEGSAEKVIRLRLLHSLRRQAYSGAAGLLLSGGTDSALLAYLLPKTGTENLTCFTMAAGPELMNARAIAHALGLPLVEVAIPTDTATITEAFAHLTNPAPDAAEYLTYLVAAEARKLGIKVLYSGAGADELLGGYRRHAAFKWIQTGSYFAHFSSGWAKWSKNRIWRSICQTAEPARSFQSLTRQASIEALMLQPAESALPPTPGIAFHAYDPRPWEMLHFLASSVLPLSDAAAMAHGVELRTPYLDDDFAATCLALPWAEVSKKVLRKWLREKNLHRLIVSRKTGFGLHQAIGFPPPRLPADASHPIFKYISLAGLASVASGKAPLPTQYAIWRLLAWLETEEVR